MLRMLSSNNDGDVITAVHSIRRLLQSHGADIHTLAAHVENGGLTEDYKKKMLAEVDNARAIGYAEGVRAAEARFRPEGKLEFAEVTLFVERQINRLPPDKQDFVRKMAVYG